MATTSNLQSGSLQAKRDQGYLQALAGIKREIQSYDRGRRSRYLDEFNRAFRSYKSVLDSGQLESMMTAADIVLIGDYHSLSTSQRYAATILEERARAGKRPVVLGVEAIFSRDQKVLDEWWARGISEQELRRRIRFDAEWGYGWRTYYELLATARERCEGVYALDCEPRGDMRRVRARDRHAAEIIAGIRERHTSTVIVALFGESHLAPSHLPRRLKKLLGQDRVLTILQNIDSLHSQAAGEAEDVDAVRVDDSVACVFNTAPLEKYESYRRYLERWSCESPEEASR